jgi:general nucleoside transport system ATP-binding protein
MSLLSRASAGAAVPALALCGVTKRFPGVLANDAVDFEAAAGEVHALLGENGAGKSTLANVITGLYRPDEGELRVDGRRVEFHTPRDALEAGIFMVHQHFRLVPAFTVAENVVLGVVPGRAQPRRVRRAAIEREVGEVAERFGLAVEPAARMWQLSVGEQQRVEILKALYRDARVLILDEPTAVLTPQESEALFAAMRHMTAEGKTVIFVSHKLKEVMAVADRSTVLRGGRSLATVRTADTSTAELARLMVGRDVVFDRRKAASAAREDSALSLAGVSCDGDRGVRALHDVTLDVRAGEILGVAGVAGNGQRELAEVVAGIRSRTAGAVTIGGRPLPSGSPRAAAAAGLGYVPEDRMPTGLAPSLSIAENLALRSYRRPPMARPPFVLSRRLTAHADTVMRASDIRAPGPATPARVLSGGNAQKVILARELGARPSALVVASPTRGLDVGATEAVRGLLVEAARSGTGVLLISEDLDELLMLSDRIVVVYGGRLAGELDGADADPDRLGMLMSGAAA